MKSTKNSPAKKRNRVVAAICGSSILGVAVIGGATLQTANAQPAPQEVAPNPIASTDLTLEAPTNLISSQQEPQSKLDVLPSFLLSGEREVAGLSTETSRFVGEDGGTSFWTVEMGEMVCLVAVLPGAEPNSALSCDAPETLQGQGIPLQIADGENAVEGYLLPDGATDTLSADEGLNVVSPNLVTIDPLAVRDAGGPQQAARGGSQAFDLSLLPPLDPNLLTDSK